MNYKVVYFSRTGNSKRAAEKIAAGLNCEASKIEDDINWGGALGLFKGLFYVFSKKDVKVKADPNLLDTADEIVLVSPIWGGSVTPSVKSFIKLFPKEKINLVCTSSGTGVKAAEGFKSVTDILRYNKNEDEVIAELTEKLNNQ